MTSFMSRGTPVSESISPVQYIQLTRHLVYDNTTRHSHDDVVAHCVCDGKFIHVGLSNKQSLIRGRI